VQALASLQFFAVFTQFPAWQASMVHALLSLHCVGEVHCGAHGTVVASTRTVIVTGVPTVPVALLPE
jgi:hypothetical protein